MTSVKRREHHDSGEYSDASQDIEHNNLGNDAQQESDYDSAGSDSEHSDKDQNSQEAEQRRVDDDEDRSNPQYIPKRGTFYEHDDRTAASGEETGNTTSETASDKKETEAPPERRRPPRKSEIIDKWSHDKFNENEQMPKSREELVAIYGYDIRNEDAPPHARRNRRYGRGPNKYTRTWEDEDAYRRGAAPPPHRRPPAPAPAAPPSPNDFPDLETAHRSKKSGRQQRPRSKSQPASNTSSDSGSQLRRNASTKAPKGKPKQEAVKKTAPNKYTPRTPQAKEKMPPLENLTITATVYNNNQGQPQRKVMNASVAQQKPVPTEQGKKKPQPQAQQPPQQNNTAPKPQPQSQPSPQQQPKQQSQNQQQQNQQQQPASGGAEQRGSKRYSSLRQRPLAETYSPQQPPPQAALQTGPQNTQQQHRYVAEYQPASSQNAQTSQHQGSPVPQIHPQQMMHQVHRNPPVSQQQHGPSPPHQALPQHTQQQVRLGMLEQPQLVSHPHHQLHNMPQTHAMGQLQPTQGYAPPAMMPAQYMQIPRSLGSQTAAIEQAGNSAVFAGAMYAPPPPGPYHTSHQLYQHHNYATQAGGVTYYSPVEQEQAPRAQRRPTAAIPIVRPAHPPHPPHADRPANPTEKDNIDRIVENMFVRKPWPATHGTDSKEKSENRNSQEPQSKENSQPNSLTSSSISTDSKPSENKEEKIEEQKEEDKKLDTKEMVMTESTDVSAQAESISADA